MAEWNHGFFFVYRRLWSNTNCSSFGHRELFQFSPISCVSIFVIFFFFGSTSLLFGTIIYSKPHLYILCPSPRITNFFPGSPSSCCWRTLLATKFWGIGIRVATWISLLLGPLNWQRKEIICDPCMYSYLYSLYIATRNIHWAKAKHEFISMPATLMQYRWVILTSSLVSSLFQFWKLAPTIPHRAQRVGEKSQAWEKHIDPCVHFWHTCIAVSELLTHTLLGNKLITSAESLCIISVAFNVIDSTNFQKYSGQQLFLPLLSVRLSYTFVKLLGGFVTFCTLHWASLTS